MRIAPEGRPFILIGLAVTLIAGAAAAFLSGAWTIPFALSAIILLWIVAFFRDPARNGPSGKLLVLAPADGKVVSIEEVDEPQFIQGKALRISIFMNVFNVHVNRYPVSGAIEFRRYFPGKFLNASLDKASELNERMSLGIESSGGRFLVTQIAGLVARRIVTDAGVGDTAEQGARLGVIRFGSRVDTFIPTNARVSVKAGQKTKAGISVLAELME